MLTFVALVGAAARPDRSVRISALDRGLRLVLLGELLSLLPPERATSTSSGQLDPLLHTWTLAVEEQFYVCFPRAARGAWWFGARVRGATVAARSRRSRSPRSRWSRSCFAHAWANGVGRRSQRPGAVRVLRLADARVGVRGRLRPLAAVAGPSPRSGARRHRPRRAGSGGLIALTAVATSGSDPLWATRPGPGGWCLRRCWPPGLLAGNGFSRVLSLRPLVWIGDVSYSWYLWHWPLIVFARALSPGMGWAPGVAAALSLVPAWASYRYIENPVRFDRRIRGRVALAVAAVCVAVPVAASGAVAHWHTGLSASYATAFHADFLRGCDSSDPFGARCPAPGAPGGRRIRWERSS